VGIGLLEGNEVVSRAEVGAFEAAYRSVRIAMGEGVWGRVARTGETLLSPPVDGHEEALNVRSHICVPLKAQGAVIGVLSAASDRAEAFDESDRLILETLANQTSVAIENVRLHEQEKRMAVVDERRRLARDLHDSVTQSLYGMGLHAQAAARELAREQPQKAAEYLGEISDTAEQAMAEMRLLLYQLRPPVLEKEGLAAALQARLAAVEARAGLKTDFRTNLAERLPGHVEEGLYYIAQEALNNALKHSRARSIVVSLLREQAGACLEIADNGVGFDAEKAHEEGRMGLPDMEQRAAEMGGRLVVSSGRGRGTRIRVDVAL
jgi:signal transduction histidine kinase